MASRQRLRPACPRSGRLAVTRYRLYDLDLLLARTLAYATLTVGLAVLFTTLAAVGGLLIGGQAPVAVAVAAAATATAAAPARARYGAFVQRSESITMSEIRRLIRASTRRAGLRIARPVGSSK